MKIKNSFITNSSSTSFIVLGTSMLIESIPNYEKMLRKISKTVGVPYLKKHRKTIESLNRNLSDYNLSQYCQSNNSRLDASFGDEERNILYVGIPFERIENNEIYGLVKDYVKNEIKRLFDIDVDVSEIQPIYETWYG